MNDMILGPLLWAGQDNQWERDVVIPAFRGAGKNIQILLRRYSQACRQAARSDHAKLSSSHAQRKPFDHLKLLMKGRSLLEVQSAENSRSVPTSAQSHAWRQVQNSPDAIWKHLIDELFQEYQTYYSTRVQWWSAVYGSRELSTRLPALQSASTFKKLIFPWLIRINRPPNRQSSADIAIWFATTYGHIGAVIRDGRLLHLGDALDLRESDEVASVSHPTFGPLRRNQVSWSANLLLPSFTAFNELITDTRIDAKKDPSLCFALGQDMFQWDILHGIYSAHIVTPKDKQPSAAQCDVWARFNEKQKHHAVSVFDRLYQYYLSNHAALYRQWLNRKIPVTIFETDEERKAIKAAAVEFPDQRIPENPSKSQFAQMVRLIHIDIPRPRNARCAGLTLKFATSWNAFYRVEWSGGSAYTIVEV